MITNLILNCTVLNLFSVLKLWCKLFYPHLVLYILSNDIELRDSHKDGSVKKKNC